jgi:flagellar motor switch protein FliM
MSTDEIDDLLNSVTADEDGPEDKVAEPVIINGKEAVLRVYDFCSQTFLNPVLNWRLNELFCSVADKIEEALGGKTGISIDRESIRLEEVEYGIFVRSITSPTLFSLFNIEPIKGPCVLEIMPSLFCGIIDRLAWREIRDVSVNAGFTRSDADAVLTPAGMIVESLGAAMSGIADFKPAVTSIYSDPLNASSCGDNETGLLAAMECRLGYIQGIISFFLPLMTFGPVINHIDESLPPDDERVIRVPLRVRAASFDQVRKLGPLSKIEIGTGHSLPLHVAVKKRVSRHGC